MLFFFSCFHIDQRYHILVSAYIEIPHYKDRDTISLKERRTDIDTVTDRKGKVYDMRADSERITGNSASQPS